MNNMKSDQIETNQTSNPPSTLSYVQYNKLHEVLSELERDIKRQNSLKFAFLKGAVYGLGTVIGATVLLAIVTGIFAQTFGSLSDVPLIGDYLNLPTEETYPTPKSL